MTTTLSPEPSVAGAPLSLARDTSTQRWSASLSALVEQAGRDL
jgi:hypothetical protein